MSRFYAYEERSDIPLSSGGIALPSGSAFMAPGIYLVNGLSYCCTRPGLYRWWVPAGYFLNRIVWKGTDGAVDVYATISAISWNHVHGTGTEYGFDGYSLQSMSNAGRTLKWSARCGYIAAMAVWLMPQIGFNARLVNVSTIGPKNGFDDGHVIFETQHGNDWRMWDITNGCYFRDASGRHLSASQVIAHIADDSPMPERVLLDSDYKYNHDYAGALDLGLYWSWNLEGSDKFEAWYRRIFQSIV